MIMATSLSRDDIVGGLRELIALLHASGEVAGIRLVGGAALALRYFERGTTQDLDSLHIRPGSDDVVAVGTSRSGGSRRRRPCPRTSTRATP